MTILLVSHKLEDVLALCSEVAVLRSGQLVGTAALPIPKSDLVALMFGQSLTAPPRTVKDLGQAPVALSLQDVTLHEGRLHMPRLSFEVRAGEVIGLAGLDGSGQELFLRACAGLVPVHAGRILVQQQPMTGRPYPDFFRRGVVFGAAGRLEEGLIAGMTIAEHLALVMPSPPKGGWLGRLWINRERVRGIAQEKIRHYNIRGTADSRIESLSGGNQQRVLMAMLPEKPVALLLEQPTRGLDVDSAAWIWEQLAARCAAGAALVFSSPDLDELLTYSDRIIVFYAGHPTLIEHPDEMTVARLGHLIGGAEA